MSCTISSSFSNLECSCGGLKLLEGERGCATAGALTKARVLITICADEIEPHFFQKISARWREAWLKFEVNSLFGFVWSLGDK
jgi:hypothetical protein